MKAKRLAAKHCKELCKAGYEHASQCSKPSVSLSATGSYVRLEQLNKYMSPLRLVVSSRRLSRTSRVSGSASSNIPFVYHRIAMLLRMLS